MTISQAAIQRFEHILFVADVGSRSSFHIGDEAMLECNLLMFRRLLPASRFTVVTLDPAMTQDLYGTAAVSRLDFSDASSDRYAELQRINQWVSGDRHQSNRSPDARQALLDADLLVISGGGNLSSTWPEHILERLALVRLAKAQSIPVVILGQTIGPVLAGNDMQLVAEILCSADWVGLREASSVALALSLGVPLERIDYQLDDTMTLPPAPPPVMPDGLVGKRNGPTIALTVHSVFALDSPNNWLNDLAAELDQVIEATGGQLLFIPHLRAMDNGRDAGDHAIGEALAQRLKRPAAMTVLEVANSAETLWLTQQADVVVSTRYHPLVFALTKSIPCLGLPTDHYTLVKLHGALSHADRERDLIFINGSRWEGLAERVIELSQARHHSSLQHAAWTKTLEQHGLPREARLSALLEALAAAPDAQRPPCSDTTALIEGLAKIANTPKLFSCWVAREAPLQGAIDHWQLATQESEKYVLDLRRVLHLKNNEIEALIQALHSASAATRETFLPGIDEHWQTTAREAERYALDLSQALQLQSNEIESLREALHQANHNASAAISEACLQGTVEHWQTTAQQAKTYALDLKSTLQRQTREVEALREALDQANHSTPTARAQAASQEVIEHWQTAAQEAEKYALDLKRALQLKEIENEALCKALNQAKSRRWW